MALCSIQLPHKFYISGLWGQPIDFQGEEGGGDTFLGFFVFKSPLKKRFYSHSQYLCVRILFLISALCRAWEIFLIAKPMGWEMFLITKPMGWEIFLIAKPMGWEIFLIAKPMGWDIFLIAKYLQ